MYTTIEPRWQRLAQKAIADTLTRKADPAAAIVSIDPANGAIRAMAAIVPGRAEQPVQPALPQARRQPGSTFKTFVLAAAVERGMDPSSTYYVSAPFTYRPRPDGNCDDGSWWCVRTYDSSYTGWTSVERATLRSDNSVYAQLTLDVGPARVASMARRLGVRTPLQVNGAFPPAMGLGSVAVSPLDMASAYATLAAGGIYTEPTAIRRVILNGRRDRPLGRASPPHPRRSRRRRIGRHAHPRGQRSLRDGDQPRRSAGPLRARPERPTSTPMPGSSGLRRASRPPSGWATRAARCR